ncbi:3D domain-containing protein [Shouchella patagoniensis]|uniref:3D domain-containing protein n=1 Tax=Shouchella patagoniensis TaxID=228576 RepID=UPI000995C702|nr:3D domain-containing protein [Shouchella patagoniensis]
MKKLIASLAVVGSVLIATPAFAYEVQSGDTLSGIANNNNVSISDIMEANSDINDKNLIFVGQHLDLPGTDSKSSEAQVKGETQTNEETSSTPSESKSSSQDAAGTTMNVEATAYTAFCEGCTGVTYTGIDLRANPDQKVIAVDPDVIPLGSTVYVEGYGEAIAGDIGGAINGNKIDVFMPDQDQAIEFGRQNVQIEVYE